LLQGACELKGVVAEVRAFLCCQPANHCTLSLVCCPALRPATDQWHS
jgi:hypothetical protein